MQASRSAGKKILKTPEELNTIFLAADNIFTTMPALFFFLTGYQ